MPPCSKWKVRARPPPEPTVSFPRIAGGAEGEPRGSGFRMFCMTRCGECGMFRVSALSAAPSLAHCLCFACSFSISCHHPHRSPCPPLSLPGCMFPARPPGNPSGPPVGRRPASHPPEGERRPGRRAGSAEGGTSQLFGRVEFILLQDGERGRVQYSF